MRKFGAQFFSNLIGAEFALIYRFEPNEDGAVIAARISAA